MVLRRRVAVVTVLALLLFLGGCVGSLIEPVKRGHTDEVRAIIAEGGDVNEKDIDGMSPLHLAVISESHEILQLLVQGGADVNILDDEQKSPLEIAISNSDEVNAEILLKGGADPNGKSSLGKPFLFYAIHNTSPSLVAVLLRNGADSSVTSHGVSALRMAVIWAEDWTAGKIVGALLKAGARIEDDVIPHGLVPLLHQAVYTQVTGSLEALLRHKANPNSPDPNTGMYPLHLAVEQESRKMVRVLLEFGADINVKNRAGMTPIQVAQQDSIADRGLLIFIEKLLIPNRWVATRKDDTRRGYGAFLRKYPANPYKSQALARIATLDKKDRASFERAKRANTAGAYRAYLKKNPNGVYRGAAYARIIDLFPRPKRPQAIADLIRTNPESAGLLPPRHTLYFLGPKGMQVYNLLAFKKQGLNDDIIASLIIAKQPRYRVFGTEELIELNHLGLSGKIVNAMILSTQASVKDEDRRRIQQENAAGMSKLREQLKSMEGELIRLREEQNLAVARGPGSSGRARSAGSVVSDCLQQKLALKACDQIPFPGGLICESVAKSKFACPLN